MERRKTDPARKDRSSGFTLIELLIVVAIIGTLAALITGGVSRVRKKAMEAEAINDVNTVFGQALAAYDSDMNRYPGWDTEVPNEDFLEELNDIPKVIKALAYSKEEGGGRNGPYVELKDSKMAVVDLDEDEGFMAAVRSEMARATSRGSAPSSSMATPRRETTGATASWSPCAGWWPRSMTARPSGPAPSGACCGPG